VKKQFSTKSDGMSSIAAENLPDAQDHFDLEPLALLRPAA